MAVESNIPPQLHLPILRHWLRGESVNEILRWIDATNRRRRRPVLTSRAAIERLIARAGRKRERFARTLARLQPRGEGDDPLTVIEELRETYAQISATVDDPLHGGVEALRRLRALGRLEEAAWRRAVLGLRMDADAECATKPPRVDCETSGETSENETASASASRLKRAPAPVLDAPGFGRYGPAVPRESDGLPRPCP